MPLPAVFLLLFAISVFGSEDPPSDSSSEVTVFGFDIVSGNPVEHGERLSAVLGCIGCHKPDLTGEDWSDPEYGVLWTANLTQSAAAFSHEELTAMIVDGKRPDRALMDMPSYLFSDLNTEDLSALVSYLKSLPVSGPRHPEPTAGPKLTEEIESGEFRNSVQQLADMEDRVPIDLGPEHAFGRFIVRATCVECHGMNLQGGSGPMGDAPTPPNLLMVAAYSAEDFFTLMKTGKPIGDRELKVMGGVSRGRYSRLTDSEVSAIYGYLVELSRQR